MYTRGKFGIEYTPSEPKPETPWLGRVIFVVAIAAIILVIRSILIRITSPAPEYVREERVTRAEGNAAPVVPSVSNSATNGTVSCAADDRAGAISEHNVQNRPVKVRNLLLRLKEAERKGDAEMAISTIEQLRAMPNAADLDDALARKLGKLNFKRLFELKSAQWTVEAVVKRGDSATRIAYEHGSTFASLVKLNGGSPDKLKIGQKLTVMNHPRFSLVITRRTRTADLMLNGKFFKRYDLTGDVTGEAGSYQTPERFRTFCVERGVPFKPLDRAELEMLLPKGASAFIREI